MIFFGELDKNKTYIGLQYGNSAIAKKIIKYTRQYAPNSQDIPTHVFAIIYRHELGDCKQYNIAVTPDTVLTHYEFGKKHPKTTSYGKPDISYLHPYPELKPAEIGDYIRNKVKWYLSKI